MKQQRGWPVDVVIVLVAMTSILSVFDDTFADRSYLVAGLAPVVLLLLLAFVARQVHEGGWWYFLAALIVFPPLGALAALREPGPFLFPTVDTMTRVLVQSVGAPTTLVSTVPPVDPGGQVMLVPFLIGFLGTAAAAWLALGTSRALAPVVPLVLSLAATIPLGVLVPTLMVSRGIVLGVVLIAWATVRARRGEGGVRASRGSMAPAVTAVTTVALVSGLVGLLVPDDDQADRVLLRGEENTSLVSDAVSSLPDQTDSGEVLFKVSGVPEGRRVRIAALDVYDGTRWEPAEESPGSEGYGTFKRIGHEVAALHPGTTVVVRVQIRRGYASDWLPMLGQLTSIDFDWNPGTTEVTDVRYNQATSSALVVGGVDSRDAYTFESVVGDDRFSRRDRTREPSDDQRQPAGAFLDQYLRPFDRKELLPLERVLLMARYLRTSGTVRYVVSAAQSPDDLGRRMLGSRRIVGNPYEYGALMALAASRLGVPARVVSGAEPGPRGIVTRGDVTTWVELQFADGSWRPLDPARYVGSRVARDGADPVAAEEPEGFVNEQLVDAARGRDAEIRLPDGATNPDGTRADEPTSPGRILLSVLGAGLGMGVLAVLLVPVFKVVRRRRRRSAGGWSGPYVNGWQEVLDTARDRGTPVPEAWGRVAQAASLGAGLDLARQADRAVFAPGPGDAADSQEFWQSCQVLRRRLLADVDARHRWWSWFNPASLLAGWERRRSSRRSGVRPVGDEDRRTGRQ